MAEWPTTAARKALRGTVLHTQACEAQCATRPRRTQVPYTAFITTPLKLPSTASSPEAYARRKRRFRGPCAMPLCMLRWLVVVIRFGGHTPALAAYKFPARS